jgi:ABC-type multidrug transport system ATPase subunit
LIAVSLHNVGKKFNREWIFRGIDYEINEGAKLALLGGNGSGKSTLLQIISGFVSPNEGQINYTLNGTFVDPESVQTLVAFAAPYLQLTEDFTLTEIITHVKTFKPFVNGLSVDEVIEIIGLNTSTDKFIRHYSSGMKQRLKLGLAFLADTPLLLLDEPVSNLDRKGINWYRGMIEKFGQKRTVIVCSNSITEEYDFCQQELIPANFKLRKVLSGI